MNHDYLDYKLSEKMYYQNNLKKIIEFVGIKYNIAREYIVLGEKIKRANLKQTKKFICEKCFEYFKIKITLKQIDCLLQPWKGKFPYTSIIIIETIYNLLESEWERYALTWREECIDYLEKRKLNDLKYEEFLMGSLPERISNKLDEFMDTKYREIFICLIDSRVLFQEMFGETSIRECLEKFPIKQLSDKQIPRTMYNYQSEIIYLKD